MLACGKGKNDSSSASNGVAKVAWAGVSGYCAHYGWPHDCHWYATAVQVAHQLLHHVLGEGVAIGVAACLYVLGSLQLQRSVAQLRE